MPAHSLTCKASEARRFPGKLLKQLRVTRTRLDTPLKQGVNERALQFFPGRPSARTKAELSQAGTGPYRLLRDWEPK